MICVILLMLAALLTTVIIQMHSGQFKARNGETQTTLLSVRTACSNFSRIARVRPGVNPSVRYKAESSSGESLNLFDGNSILKSLQAHTMIKATKGKLNFQFSIEKLEAFIALQCARGIVGRNRSAQLL